MSISATVHKWCGLLLGGVLTLIALTGIYLLLAEEVGDLMGTHIVASGRAPITLDLQLSRAGLPRESMAMIGLPRSPTDPTVFLLDAPLGYERVHVDPASGQILARTFDADSLDEIVYYLHSHLLLGEPGHILAGLCALTGIVMLVTGLMLWWPRRGGLRGAFTVRRGAPLRFWRDIHKLGGAVMAIPLALQLMTGAALVFFLPVTALVGHLTDSAYRHFDGGSSWTGRDFPLQPLLDRAKAEFPTATPTLLEMPRRPGDGFHLRLRQASEAHPNGRTFVTLDPSDGTLLFRDDARDTTTVTGVMNAVYPLHIGATGGAPHKLLSMLAGLVLAALMPTGTWFWWLRRRSRQRKAAATGSSRDAGAASPRVRSA